MAGTMVADASVRQIFWGIDGVGLVVATTLLAIRALRAGHDMMAAGFLVFALGETVLVSSNPAGLAAALPSFGGGVVLWAAGLLLVSGPAVLPGWCAPPASSRRCCSRWSPSASIWGRR